MKLTEQELRMAAAGLPYTHDGEIGCDDAFARFAARAEEEIAGLAPSAATRAVAQHLEDCPECGEEYGALLDALRDDA